MSQSTDPSKIVYEPPDAERPASSTPPPEEILAAQIAADQANPHSSETPIPFAELPPPQRDPYAALRHRDFCLFMLGYVLSVVGDQVMEVAVGWELYQRTHNAMSLAWVGLVSAAPVILLALPAGHLADVFDRRQIVLISQWIRSACVLGLAVLSYQQGPVGMFYFLLFFVAVAKSIGWPARSAMLPALVPPEYFANAVMWNSSSFQISAMLGPALGGWLLLWSLPGSYCVTAACTIVFALTMLPMKPRFTVERKEPASLQSLLAGLRFVFNTQIILATITLDLFAVLLGGAVYLLPIFASKDILNVGAVGFGWMRAAPAIGALSTGILIAHLPPMKHAGRAMLWAVAGFGAATIVFGLSRNFWLSLAMLFLTGALDNISVLVRHTLVQVLTPDEMRGRVSAVNNVFIGASNELGGFESGATAKLWGAITSTVFGGIGTIVVVIASSILWPKVREFGSLNDARPEVLPPPSGFEVLPSKNPVPQSK